MRPFRRTRPSWRGSVSVWRRSRWPPTWMRFSRRRSGSIKRPWPVPPARWWFSIDNSHHYDQYLCFSGEAKGRYLDQVFPCLLLRLPANALRDEVENQRTNKQKTKISIHRQRKCPKCNAAFGASDYHRCLNTCIFHKYSSVFFTNTIFLLCLMNTIPPQALPFVSDPNKNKKEEAVLTGFSLEWMSWEFLVSLNVQARRDLTHKVLMMMVVLFVNAQIWQLCIYASIQQDVCNLKINY